MTKYAAKLDASNTVRNVITIGDEVSNVENFCAEKFGGTWKESFKDGTRKQPAVIGGTYDAAKDKFISEQPYDSWTLDSNDDWQPPVAIPDISDEDYKGRTWDEDNQRWTAFKVSDGNQYAWDPDNSTWTAI